MSTKSRNKRIPDCGRYLQIFLTIFVVIGSSLTQAHEHKDREFRECRDCPVMVGVPAGTFLMGSPKTEVGRFSSDGPQHVVSIKAFALGKYEITNKQFLSFLKKTGYQPRPCDQVLGQSWRSLGHGLAYSPGDNVEPPNWPAVCLDWHDAEAFIAWLNAKVHRARPGLAAKGPYRLPSEAEWEYAARAGTTTVRWWGETISMNHANCNGCGSSWDDRLLAPVTSFSPNPFGLYGMLGNAWQWTADCWHPNYVHAPRDGSAKVAPSKPGINTLWRSTG